MLALMALLAGVVASISPGRPGVTEKNGWRIKEGMTKAEVESILGGPPSPRGPGRLAYEKEGDGTLGVWLNRGLGVWVFFDEKGKVWRNYCYGRQTRPSWSECLRQLLPW
jgi:hypothetical protein